MRRATPLALALLLAFAAGPAAPQPAVAAHGPVSAEALAAAEDAASKAPLTADGRYIVVLKHGKGVDAVEGRAGRLGVKADRTFRNAVHGFSAKLTPGQLAALRLDPDVDSVVPDEIISIAGQSIPTGVRRVSGKDSLVADINGADPQVDADVAIVDTGIGGRTTKAHEDLNIVGGISCSTDNPNSWGDPNGHGTHVAGTVGALDNGIGVVGVAPGVRLWSVRILDSAGDGLISWYVCGLDWIAAQRDPDDPSRPLIEAVNMSVARSGTDDGNCGYTTKDLMHQAICRLVDSGVTVVAAAGNNSFNAKKLKPASYDEVITVSALADTDGKPGGLGGSLCYSWGSYDVDDTFADFSNYGRDVDLIAPGKCIFSTLPGNAYGYISGTSMAAPHVTGAAALYRSSRPDATPAETRAALIAAGTFDWNLATDPDTRHEPLLDVSHIVSLGDFTVDATPGTSHSALVNADGGSLGLPVQLIRAEDFPDAVDLEVTAEAPLGGTLADTQLTGQDARRHHHGGERPARHPERHLYGHRDGLRRHARAHIQVPGDRGQHESDGRGARPRVPVRRGPPSWCRHPRDMVAGDRSRRLHHPLPGPLARRRQPGFDHGPGSVQPQRRAPDASRPHVRTAGPGPGRGRELERLGRERRGRSGPLAGHEPVAYPGGHLEAREPALGIGWNRAQVPREGLLGHAAIHRERHRLDRGQGREPGACRCLRRWRARRDR